MSDEIAFYVWLLGWLFMSLVFSFLWGVCREESDGDYWMMIAALFLWPLLLAAAAMMLPFLLVHWLGKRLRNAVRKDIHKGEA